MPASEARFRALVEHAPELVFELGPDGILLYVGPSIRKVLGYEPDALLGSAPLELIHPEDREAVVAAFEGALRDGTSIESVHRARHRDGSWRWIKDSARSYRNDAGQPRIVVVGRDVTDYIEMRSAHITQLEQQRMLAKLSRSFLALRGGEIDAGIREHLADAAQLAGSQRTSLIAIDGTPAITDVYDWWDPGVTGVFPDRDPGFERKFTWSLHKLHAGQIINVPDVTELPDAARVEREDLVRRGVLSLLVIPLQAGDQVIARSSRTRSSAGGSTTGCARARRASAPWPSTRRSSSPSSTKRAATAT